MMSRDYIGTMPAGGRRFKTREPVDFVVIGSGAAGGVMAKELSSAGFDVVVLEQGPYLRAQDFKHDDLAYIFNQELIGGARGEFPQTMRRSEDEEAAVQDFPPPLLYARMVGGSSVHFSANYWRFRPIDFVERSTIGAIEGTGFADWPIGYDELEPYYTRVEWEIGVSGAPGPFDPPRSKPFPLPPLPNKSGGVLFEQGARKLGLHPQPAPMAILSRPYDGRAACGHCGYCMLFGCEFGAKSSTLATMIPLAEATGRCEIRPESTVVRLETDKDGGRVREVVYLDGSGAEHAQQARAVVLCANGAETPRLLLMSDSSRHPNGLANSSGKVGKYLMFNCQPLAYGLFEHPLNEYKSAQVTRILLDYYDSDPARGYYGGGGLDARPFLSATPLGFALSGLPPDAPTWGPSFKQMLHEYFTRTVAVSGHTTSLPVESNNISLDPSTEDKWGRPAIRVTYRDHADDLAISRFFLKKGEEILDAAGARKVWTVPVTETSVAAHLLGTCRMGDDPAESVVDRYHRSHDVRNLFIVDGSSFVTSGRGQPTMTIQALAFRAADHIGEFGRRGDI